MALLITSHPLSELSSLEVHQMYKLRVDVFVHEQQCTYAEIDDHDAEPSTHHVLAWDVEKHVLLGTARIFPTEIDKQKAWKFGRFCLAPTARGTGLAADIMAHALALSESESVILDAQVPLVEFYQDFGFKPVGEEFDDEGMMHQPMRRDTPGILETAALAD